MNDAKRHCKLWVSYSIRSSRTLWDQERKTHNRPNAPSNWNWNHTKSTIIDVSGQIVFRDIVEGATSGSYVWDMFSKDGIEVSSGLYIYHIEYDGGAATGHFAILR
jgi:hypothetical protein